MWIQTNTQIELQVDRKMRYYIKPAQTDAKNSLTIQLINLQVNKR